MKAAFPLLGLVVYSLSSCRDNPSAPAASPKTRDRAKSSPARLQPIASQEPGYWKYHFTAAEDKQIAQNNDLQTLLQYYLDINEGSERTLDRQTLLARLNAEDFRLLILKTAFPLNETRENYALLGPMGKHHPRECLAFLDEIAPHLDSYIDLTQIALIQIARKEPALAEAWLNRNSSLFEEQILTNTECSVLRGIAYERPALGFETADRWGLGQNPEAIREILRYPVTLKEKAAAVTELRSRAAAATEPQIAASLISSGFAGLGAGLGFDYDSCGADVPEQFFDFNEIVRFLDEIRIAPGEREGFSEDFGGPSNSTEFSKWIDWTRQNTSGSGVHRLEMTKDRTGGS